jgi:hypothetical protein
MINQFLLKITLIMLGDEGIIKARICDLWSPNNDKTLKFRMLENGVHVSHLGRSEILNFRGRLP